jgi:hypothetical protein
MSIPDDDAWSPWHPADLGRRLQEVGRPWCVVGGWALDLWHGRQTREHEDLEFAILRDDAPAFRAALGELAFFTVHDGAIAPLAPDAVPPPHVFQIWGLDAAARRWRIDMMIEPGTPSDWVYRRDPRITRPRAEMVGLTADGLSYLNPAAVLLFKAKHLRDKDLLDFEAALPRLAPTERIWLRDCLARLHAGHPWIGRL